MVNDASQGMLKTGKGKSRTAYIRGAFIFGKEKAVFYATRMVGQERSKQSKKREKWRRCGLGGCSSNCKGGSYQATIKRSQLNLRMRRKLSKKLEEGNKKLTKEEANSLGSKYCEGRSRKISKAGRCSK